MPVRVLDALDGREIQLDMAAQFCFGENSDIGH